MISTHGCNRNWLALTGLLIAAAPRATAACAVCFGDPDSDMVRATKIGMIILGVIVYGILCTFVGIAGFWAFKARRLAAAASHSEAESTPPDSGS